MPLYWSLLLLLLISLSIPVALSSPFSSLSITTIGNNTVVCALVPRDLSLKTSELICRSYPSGEEINYSSEVGYDGEESSNPVQYSALATADDYLCGLKSSPCGTTSMLWWSFEDDHDVKKRVYSGAPLLALSAGDSHVCALTINTSLACWRWRELQVPDEDMFNEIAVGGEFVCGITTLSGAIKCYGNEIDVVGKEPPGSFLTLAAGSHHVCAVNKTNDIKTGNLTCWGSGAPEMDSIPGDLVDFSLGTNITCILTSNGIVKCWGRGVTPPDGRKFVSVEAKGDTVCGVSKEDYKVICWGSKNFENTTVVYSKILPGTCSLAMSCDAMPGSAEFCSEGYVICQPSTILLSNSRLVVPAPPANPPPTNTAPPTSRDTGPPGVNNNRIKFVVMIVGITGGVLVSSVVIAGFVLFKLAKKKEKSRFDLAIIDPTVSNPERSPASLLPRNGFVSEQFTFRSLHRATDGFADGNKIGSGGFGTVYWGVLPDGRQAALKRAHHQRRRNVECFFLSELALLSRLNHKNLVGLIGFCEERGERIIVVEYMQNGTLYDHLHRLPPSDSSPLFTSWTARLKIALDAARGIEYLHSYAVPGIIHRDIKSSNILLDSTWTAKVSDFGLSLTTNTSTGTSTAGTVGYMDPEYYRLQELTAKSDVYSFGIVLLEIITGLKAVFKSGEDDEPCHVAEYVMPILSSGDTKRLFDERVPMRDDKEEEAVDIVVKLAAHCVRARGKSRPTMKEVVKELEWALGLCADDEEMVEVVLEVEERLSTVSSMSTYDHLE